jgi:hypothetical protein
MAQIRIKRGTRAQAAAAASAGQCAAGEPYLLDGALAVGVAPDAVAEAAMVAPGHVGGLRLAILPALPSAPDAGTLYGVPDSAGRVDWYWGGAMAARLRATSSGVRTSADGSIRSLSIG